MQMKINRNFLSIAGGIGGGGFGNYGYGMTREQARRWIDDAINGNFDAINALMRNGARLLRWLINTGYLVRADYQQLLLVPHFVRVAFQVFGEFGPFNIRLILPVGPPVKPVPVKPTLPPPASTIIPIPPRPTIPGGQSN